MRGDTVLDAFGGSGTTLVAAETCGRITCLMEYDPLYCDTVIARWQKFTGKRALLSGTGQSFEQAANQMREREDQSKRA